VGLAYIFKQLFSHESIPIGAETTSDDTRELLSGWADKIVVLRPHYVEAVPPAHRHKVLVYDVGEDIWLNPYHQNLQHELMKLIRKDGFFLREDKHVDV